MGKDDDPVVRFELPPGWGEEIEPSPDAKPTKLSEQIVAQSRKARREPLSHFCFRLPREMLSKFDEIAAEKDISVAAVIRAILSNALKRKRKSTSVKRVTGA